MPSHYVDVTAWSPEGFLIARGIWPSAIAVLTLVLLPIVLLVWCRRDGTLRIAPTVDNPTGHGLLSPINLYLLVVPALNYSIFAYYLTVQEQLDRLRGRQVIALPTGGPYVVPDGLGLAMTIAAWSLALVCAAATLRQQRRPGLPVTTWLRRNSAPRPIAYYFTALFFVLELSLLFSWFFRHIFTWAGLHYVLQDAQLDAFAPDLMLGLRPLNAMIWSAFETMALVTLLVGVWLVGGRVTLRAERFTANPGHVVAAVGMSLCGLCVVLLPLLSAHAVMERTRETRLERLATDVTRLASALETAIRTSTASVEEQRKTLEVAQKLYADAERSTTWPVSAGDLTFFSVTLASPLASLADQVIKRLQRRRKRAASQAVIG